VAFHSSGQTTFNCNHIEGITLGAGEKVVEVAGGASGMGVDRIGDKKYFKMKGSEQLLPV
jgi:hypothetical protein